MISINHNINIYIYDNIFKFENYCDSNIPTRPSFIPSPKKRGKNKIKKY